jgi:hypothetical protein
VPSDDDGRLDQHHHLQTAWPQSVEYDSDRLLTAPYADLRL